MAPRYGFYAVLFLILVETIPVSAQNPPSVTVIQPTEKLVTTNDFQGIVVPGSSVEVKARVSGYLVKVNFVEGSEVREGDLLFEIDPRPFQLQFERAQGHIGQVEARQRRIAADLARIRELVRLKAASAEEFAKLEGEMQETQAALHLARVEVEREKLNLAFTRIHAPLTGRIGRALLSPGNLVEADKTLLTTLVSKDPLLVQFSVDERSLAQLFQEKGKEKANDAVEIGFALEAGYPHRGKLVYVEPWLNPKKKSALVRAVLPTPPDHLRAGMSARVRIPGGKVERALQIPEIAIVKSEGLTWVFMVNAQNVLFARPIELGAREGREWVVVKGVQAGDWIVADPAGLKADMVVRPLRTKPGNP